MGVVRLHMWPCCPASAGCRCHWCSRCGQRRLVRLRGFIIGCQVIDFKLGREKSPDTKQFAHRLSLDFPREYPFSSTESTKLPIQPEFALFTYKCSPSQANKYLGPPVEGHDTLRYVYPRLLKEPKAGVTSMFVTGVPGASRQKPLLSYLHVVLLIHRTISFGCAHQQSVGILSWSSSVHGCIR